LIHLKDARGDEHTDIFIKGTNRTQTPESNIYIQHINNYDKYVQIKESNKRQNLETVMKREFNYTFTKTHSKYKDIKG
jgi:hypothetical protein